MKEYILNLEKEFSLIENGFKEELDGWDNNSKEIQQVYKLASKFIKW